MTDHEHFEELISLRLDGALDEEGEAALRAHLETCRECRELLALLTGVHDALNIEKDPPEALLRGVMEGVERAERTRKTVKMRWTGIAAGALAAAAALAVAFLPHNAKTPDSDSGIAAYSSDTGTPVSLFPDTKIGLPGEPAVCGSVDDLTGIRAAAYFRELPADIAQTGPDYIFANGDVGYDVPEELMEAHRNEAVRIDTPDPAGAVCLAVLLSEK